MAKFIKADAIKYVLEDSESRTLLHVCNDQGVMGSGIAIQVKKTWPSAFEAYKDSAHTLGTTSWNWDGARCVINMVAQKGYGKGIRHLNYGALGDCLAEVEYHLRDTQEVVIPYKMGADRAGGDWEIVLEMVEYYFEGYSITVCEKGE